MTRILILLSLAATGLLATVAAADAAIVTNASSSYAYSGFVPCANDGAGELVNGKIDSHVLVTSTTNEQVDVSTFQSAPRGTLVGASSGDVYRLTGVTRGTYVTVAQGDRYSATYVSRYQLIGRAGTSHLVVSETAHITRAGDDVIVERDEFSIECA